MNEIQRLLKNYSNYIRLPWADNLSSSEAVWFAIYPPEQERQLHLYLDEFAIETQKAEKIWQSIDLSQSFTQWLEREDAEERDSLFQNPKDLSYFAQEDFPEFLSDLVKEAFASAESPENTVFALHGLMNLYDHAQISALMTELEENIPGRLLLFFPGSKEENAYRFINARKGWDYLAVAIDSLQEQFN